MRFVARSFSISRWLCAALLAGAAPASATTVTVVITGTLTDVTDSNSVTDGSLVPTTPYTLTMSYDDSVTDSDPDPLFGTYLNPASTSAYDITVGNYQFSSGGVLNIGVINGFYAPNEDTLGWFADQFAHSGSLPPGVAFGSFGYSNVALNDFTGKALSSDRLVDLVWDRSRYAPDNAAFYLFLEIIDPRTSGQDFLELSGTIDLMTVLPEPSYTLLLVAVLSGLVLRRRFR